MKANTNPGMTGSSGFKTIKTSQGCYPEIVCFFSLERKLIFKKPFQVVIRLWSELWLFNTFFLTFGTEDVETAKGDILFSKNLPFLTN